MIKASQTSKADIYEGTAAEFDGRAECPFARRA